MNLVAQYTVIATLWHPTKNGDLKPEQFSKGSNKKVWWLCPIKCNEGCLHEWEMSFNSITSGSSCPYCSNHSSKKICIHNSIVYTHPNIANEWHTTKNGDLKLETISFGYGKKVWWLCPIKCSEGCLHEWEDTPNQRTYKNRDCPFCSTHKIKNCCIHDSIIWTHPEIAKQWHPTKNGDLILENLTSGSNVNVWWLCPNKCKEGCLHEWQTSLNHRIGRNTGCPYCSTNQLKHCIHDSIVWTNQELAKQWHPTKNGELKPEDFIIGSAKSVWWLCEKKCKEGCLHEWASTIRDRVNNGCPCCSRKKNCIHESITWTHSELVKQWHPTKNGELKPEHFILGSHTKVWWLCEQICSYGCLHEWETAIINRTNGYGCPFCSKHSSREICIHDSIVYTHPEIAKQWHPTKNGDLKPENFTYGSGNVWWFSNVCNHEWEASIANRTGRGDGCTKCINKTEEKLYDELCKYYPLLKQQFKVEWCKNKKHLPYDFVLENDKIIIELDGVQHFKDIISWHTTLKETHENDIYKMKCANNNSFSIIRIYQPDVWNDTYDWINELKDNIEKIRLEKIIQNIYMCKNNEYDIFII